MSKKIDWNSISKPFGTQKLPHDRSQSISRKDKIKKAYADLAKQEELAKNKAALEPHLNKKLMEFLVNKSEIIVTHPFQYEGDILQEGNTPKESRFVKSQQVLTPGTKLKFKFLDSVIDKLVFKKSDGEEIELNTMDKQSLLYNTNIYSETLSELSEEKGE